MTQTDILIIGGGSAGFGAAYAALCAGASVVLCEREPILGGTSTCGGVNTWEPGVAGNGVHYEIARRLLESGDGFVGKTVSYVTGDRRYALSDRSDSDYAATLRRAGLTPDEFRRFHFEPDAMARVMAQLLNEAGGGKRLT